MEEEKSIYRRRPGIAWRDEEEAAREAVAGLEEGRDVTDEGTLILVDAGQVFELNLLGAEIWKLCDGEKAAGEIIDDLMGRFEVTREELAADVAAFLEEMIERGWMERA